MPDKQWEVLPPEEVPGESSTKPLGRHARLALAFGVAVVSDALSIWLQFAPPVQWLLDFATAGVLYVALGRQWFILPALVAEAIPGLALFPTWILVVLSIAMWGTVRPLGRAGGS
jgi:hypothetical protein